ncbi:LptF/LptG family permease [bacterium]|nr:LptF/LptG family permease [bacterium]
MNKKLLKFTIYDKYIFNQLLITTFVAILLFTIVWIAPEILLNTIKHTISGLYTPKEAVLVLILELPKILGKALPVGLLLGTLFTFDKLSKDSELTIFRAIGLSFNRIIVPVIALSLIGTVLCFITYDKLIPIAEQTSNNMSTYKPNIQYIYTKKDKNNVPQQSIIVSSYHNGDLEKVIVLDFSEQLYQDVHGLSNIYIAKTGKTFPNYWELKDVTKYKVSLDGIYTDISKLKSMKILDGEDANDAEILITNSVKRDREFTNGELRRYLQLLKREDLDEDYRFMLNKYFQRFFHPFVCILLAVMGSLLGFSKPREQRLIGFTIAIGCIFIYYITLPFFDLLAEKGVLHPLLTAGIPPIAFLFAILGFYKSKDL